MTTYFVAFLVALMASLVLTVVVRNRALKWGWVDQAISSRNIHLKTVPRLGGIAIVLGFFAPLAALFIVDSGVGQTFRGESALISGLFIGGLAIAVLGFYDDRFGANARLKFTVQFAVAAFAYWLGFRIEHISSPFGGTLDLGYFSAPLTFIWIVGVVNALNLIDGLDGLAGGVAFFGVATNFVLALAHGDVLLCLIMAALAGAVLGFLVFNFNPASIFMGDTGSMFLGFVLAIVSVKTSSKSGTAVAMVVPIIALGLPIMDTLVAIIRRAAMGRPIFSADKEHIHHRLMSRVGMTHRRAVLILYGICVLFALTSLGLAYANSAQTAMLLCAVGVVVIVLMRKLGYLSGNVGSGVAEVRRRNVELRSTVHELNAGIASSESLEGIWEAVRPIAEALDGSRLELRFDRSHDGLREAITFETERDAGAALPLDVRVELRSATTVIGHLRFSWRDGRGEVNRDEELAIELAADFIARAAQRVFARSANAGLKIVRTK
jgi:UDP-GlcNAc:undecaprenyl-phosphate/decaprenyl-phosphate GlcNAc-1-phosphate transferase